MPEPRLPSIITDNLIPNREVAPDPASGAMVEGHDNSPGGDDE